jgi:hypothetical protein
MRTPGFTAAASVYAAERLYLTKFDSNPSGVSGVAPQFNYLCALVAVAILAGQEELWGVALHVCSRGLA